MENDLVLLLLCATLWAGTSLCLVLYLRARTWPCCI